MHYTPYLPVFPPPDVETLFPQWDEDSDGRLSYEDLVSALGADNVPSESDMLQYDVDHDQQYTRDDVMTAFGFNITDDANLLT